MTRLLATALLTLAACSPPPPAEPDPGSRAVVEAVFEAFNRHDAAGMAALYAPDATLTTSDYCAPLQGRAAIERLHAELFAAVPDIQDEVLEYYVERNSVAVRFVSRSDIPDRAFEMNIADFFEVRDGLVVSDITIFNAGRRCQETPAATPSASP